MNLLVKFKNELFETLGEYKKLILICYTVFLVLLIGSIVLAPNIASNMPSIDTLNKNVEGVGGSSDVGALDLFINNERGSLIVYITSIFFGISAIVMLIYDPLNIGLVSALFVKLGKGTLYFSIYLIPHGIFEFTAAVLTSVAGLVLFKFIWKFIKTIIKTDDLGFKNSISSSFNDNKKILKQSFILIIFVTILLIIAAPIEAYVSIPFADFITSIL